MLLEANLLVPLYRKFVCSLFALRTSVTLFPGKIELVSSGNPKWVATVALFSANSLDEMVSLSSAFRTTWLSMQIDITLPVIPRPNSVLTHLLIMRTSTWNTVFQLSRLWTHSQKPTPTLTIAFDPSVNHMIQYFGPKSTYHSFLSVMLTL